VVLKRDVSDLEVELQVVQRSSEPQHSGQWAELNVEQARLDLVNGVGACWAIEFVG
jgi:hypothetical protein